MSSVSLTDEQLRREAETRAFVDRELQQRFAPEDDVLRNSLLRAQSAGVPAGQISPLQGKLLQVLALTCSARRILEIGTMAGYSGIWLARALPVGGKLISLEVNARHAELARANLAEAGLAERAEVRVGLALELLPTLAPEAPFDLIFIDADKRSNPLYLEWALKLSRHGSLIVADNIVRNGQAFQASPPDESSIGAAAYNRLILEHPQLVSVAFPFDDINNGIDGFSISVVQSKDA